MQRSRHNPNVKLMATATFSGVGLILQTCARIYRDVAAVFRESMVRLSKPLPG